MAAVTRAAAFLSEASTLNSGFEFAFDDEEDDEEDEEEAELTPAQAAKKRADAAELDPGIMLTDRPAENLTMPELQAQLRQLGQRHTGKKAELIERVQLMQRKRALGLPIHDMQVQQVEESEWYMLQTANGFERAVERTLNLNIAAQGLEDKIERVWVPILEGETSVRDSSVMPSYIFIKMRMDANLHFLITDMQYVINFVGADRGGRSMGGQMAGNRGFVRPMPVTEEAYQKALALTRAKLPSPAEESDSDGPDFVENDVVEVTEGPFKGMQGPVLSVDADEETLTLALTVMGRDTPVQVPLAYADKVGDAPVAASAAEEGEEGEEGFDDSFDDDVAVDDETSDVPPPVA